MWTPGDCLDAFLSEILEEVCPCPLPILNERRTGPKSTTYLHVYVGVELLVSLFLAWWCFNHQTKLALLYRLFVSQGFSLGLLLKKLFCKAIESPFIFVFVVGVMTLFNTGKGCNWVRYYFTVVKYHKTYARIKLLFYFLIRGGHCTLKQIHYTFPIIVVRNSDFCLYSRGHPFQRFMKDTKEPRKTIPIHTERLLLIISRYFVIIFW